MTTTALRHLHEESSRLIADFIELLEIPSISTDPDFAGDVARAASWVRAATSTAGLDAEVILTEGHPIVVGRWNGSPGAPTLLIYAHYDVQPADPLDEWDSPPFEPSERDGILYARGAADDKAQVILQIAAARAAIAAGDLPINLILVFEGEEEVGSPNLTRLLPDRAAEWDADHVVIADSMMFGAGHPSLIFGMRGMTYLEIDVIGSGHDLHSGQYGGTVPNPVHALASIIASLHRADGSVAVEGFYDEVAAVPDAVRAGWRSLGWNEEAFRASAGGVLLTGEPGWSPAERLWIRPCLDVNGITGGYSGPGKKTVLPGRASAKLSCRLVPDQDPGEIARRVEAHLRSHAPVDVDVKVRALQSNPPWRADPTSALYRSAAEALERTFGRPPAVVCHGGTLPIAQAFATTLTPSVAVMGFALPGANMHGPNEWIPMEQLTLGAEAMLQLYAELELVER